MKLKPLRSQCPDWDDIVGCQCEHQPDNCMFFLGDRLSYDVDGETYLFLHHKDGSMSYERERDDVAVTLSKEHVDSLVWFLDNSDRTRKKGDVVMGWYTGSKRTSYDAVDGRVVAVGDS